MSKLEVPKQLNQNEFLDYLSLIFDLLKKLQDSNKEIMKGLDAEIQEKVGELKQLIETVESTPGPQGTKGEKGDKGDKPIAGIDFPIPQNGKDGRDGRDGRDGKNGQDADEATIISKTSNIVLETVKPLIPTIEQIEQDIPKLGEPIRDALELLQDDERLEIKAVKDLREELDELKKEIKKKNETSIMSGGVGKHNVAVYDLSNFLDGVTKTFSVPAMWKVHTIFSTSTPMTFRPTTDFTWTPTSVTFTNEINAATTLAAGQTVLILYSE